MAGKSGDKRGLGRGLSALMGDVSNVEGLSSAPKRAQDRRIPIEDIAPNPDQPRRTFSADALSELAASIAEKGIIQPLILRPHSSDKAKYQIVAGERRWRAAQLAKLHEVPAVIREFSDQEAMEVAIIENIQRDDLNAVEEAQGYKRLMTTHNRTQEEMAQALGKSRSHIANMLRLLNLPAEVLDHLAEGRLTIGHARSLVTADDPVGAANAIIEKGLSVREAEKLGKAARPAKAKKPPTKDADTRLIEGEVSASLGMRVSIDADQSGQSGKMTITYKSLEELDDLCRYLSNVRAGTI